LDVEFFRKTTGDINEVMSRGMRLIFLDVDYKVPTKHILKGISGRVHPGEMCALMGASGAGKSTLLDVIAARKSKGEISGQILFNGEERSIGIMRQTAYVMQDNVHIPVLTVRETLQFAARLRMDMLNEKVREARVQKVLDMLGLDHVSDTLVGGEDIRGISGGQLKRLSIGVEIVNLPDLIFLDEPTSGLDSAIAYECMCAVRNLANQNRTVITTIHQPSPQTYGLFDKLLLMANGRVVYFGAANEAISFFVNSPYGFEYVRGTNPADYVISVAGSFVRSQEGEFVSGDALADYYEGSQNNRTFQENIEMAIQLDKAAVTNYDAGDDREFPQTLLSQILTLSKRQAVKTIKQRRPTVAAFIRHILVAAFYGSVYYNLDKTQITDRMALLFFVLLFMVLGHQQSMPIIFEERLLFYRERGAKAVCTTAYWIASTVMMVPLTLINTLVYAAILYSMTGLNDGDGCFGYFYFIVFTTSLCGFFLCQFIAAATPSQQAAISSFPAFLFFFIAFAGFIIRLPTLQSYLTWAPAITFLRWSFQGLIINEFDDNSNIQLSPSGTPQAEAQAYDSFMHDLGFEDYERWDSIYVILANMVFFRIITFLAMKYINFEQR
jgi:ABC-type multidrug transport system ATPase subunit